MAATYTLSGDTNALIPSGTVRITRARIVTNLPANAALVDTTGKKVHLGDGDVTVAGDGTFSEALVGTNATDLNVAAGTLRYQLLIDYTSGRRNGTYASGWFEITANANIADPGFLDNADPVAVASSSTYALEAKGYRDEAQAAVTSVETISGLTGEDAAIANRINTPGSQTDVALKATYAGRAPATLDGRVVAWNEATRTFSDASDTRARRAACLRPFWAGLANRAYSPVNVLLIGDSLTEGRGATTGQDSRIWANRLLAGLRAKYQPTGITGGEGYIASWFASPTRTQRWTLTGAPTQHANYGFGRRGVRLNASGQSMALTFTGTRLDVFWYGDTTTGSFSWSVDGGSATTVSTVKASPVDGNRTIIAGLSAGSHTVTLTWVSGTVQIDGGFVMNGDESAGVRMIEGGHSGYKSADYVDAAFPRWLDNVATTNPRLIIINLGTNDAASAVPVATFKANLQQLITNLRSKFATLAGVSIVLTGSNPRGDMSVASWTPYYEAIKEVVAADPKLLFHDLQARFGTSEVAANTWGLMNADLVHHSDAGQQLYADSLLELVSP